MEELVKFACRKGNDSCLKTRVEKSQPILCGHSMRPWQGLKMAPLSVATWADVTEGGKLLSSGTCV